jgi:glycerol-3-phosphate dehydrogenase
VLVVGAGATGLGIALDLCLRGAQVVVADQGDLGQGTSGRFHGLLHSGARYSISDPQSASDCAGENQILRRIAPAAIEETGGLFIALPGDPVDYPDRWLSACLQSGVPVKEISPARACDLEPMLNPTLTRAFQVQDASIDSFYLLHQLAAKIESLGGFVALRSPVLALEQHRGSVEGAVLLDGTNSREQRIEAKIVVNAAGPWAAQIAALAGGEVPLALGKGLMIAMAARLVHTVINRCRAPSDSDVIVPIGTVCVLGTTDEAVASPEDLSVDSAQARRMIIDMQDMLPGLSHHRALRTWAGIRPLYRPQPAAHEETRQLGRAHTIIDHGCQQGIAGLVTIIGGKLTTYRLMAEDLVDLIAPRLGLTKACSTAHEPLSAPHKAHYQLTSRLRHLERLRTDRDRLLCECELIHESAVIRALASGHAHSLDDLRRDLRLGMGPCQAAFCGYRAAGLAASSPQEADMPSDRYTSFWRERWKGIHPLAWGHGLRQIEFNRRIALELLGLESEAPPRHDP